MTLKVNGKTRVSTNYNTIYHCRTGSNSRSAWSFPRILAWLGGMNIRVEPGYLIGSGTVGNGCIAEFAAHMDAVTGAVVAPAEYDWLGDGDVITMEAVGLGTLENTVRRPA